jgi:hypothetical protein
VILYHYSHPEAWPKILASDCLEPRWPREGGDLPKTVHLTDQFDGPPSGIGEGCTLRFTVDIAAEPWGPWGRANVPPELWISLGIRHPFPRPDGSGLSQWNPDADHWYVTTEPVRSASWIEARLLGEDRILWPIGV